MQTVLRLAEADSKVWEIEGTEWKLAARNSRKGEKRALQCELIFSWFLFILQILRFDCATSRFVCAHLHLSHRRCGSVHSAPQRGLRSANNFYGSQCGCQSGSGLVVTWRMLDPSERMINISA